jgi:CYTH domain-containing protein
MALELERKFLVAHDGWKHHVVRYSEIRDGLIASNNGNKGAAGSGAPKANQNARKHGLFTRDATAERREIRVLLSEARRLLEEMK